jgi:apolipoprotein D and lipocalin family protein
MRNVGIAATLKRLVLLVPAILTGCTSIPEGVQPVQNFDIDRYLGTWYEIARLDHSFERGLSRVSATYIQRSRDSIHVVNKGYDAETGRWKQAKGKARFAGDPSTGHLKVSFFGPFYGSYIVLDLDPVNYEYALVCGATRSYLWILARDTALPQPVLDKLTKKAQELGFDTDALIFVEQGPIDR